MRLHLEIAHRRDHTFARTAGPLHLPLHPVPSVVSWDKLRASCLENFQPPVPKLVLDLVAPSLDFSPRCVLVGCPYVKDVDSISFQGLRRPVGQPPGSVHALRGGLVPGPFHPPKAYTI